MTATKQFRRPLQGRYTTRHTTVIGPLHDRRMDVSRPYPLHDRYTTVTRLLHDRYMASLDRYPTVT